MGQGTAISQMRANVILKNNWLFAKVLQMESMDTSELWKLQYTNDAELSSKGKPQVKNIKEVPFRKHSNRIVNLDGPTEEEKAQKAKEEK